MKKDFWVPVVLLTGVGFLCIARVSKAEDKVVTTDSGLKYIDAKVGDGATAKSGDKVVVHYTGMQTGAAALERLCDPAAKVSAHYLIEEDGRVFSLVPEERRAWQAGVSFWKGERDINAVAIGIELANPGHEWGYRAFPDDQIEALIGLMDAIRGRWDIPDGRILGHSDVAPARKTDPEPGIPEIVTFEDPKGTTLEVFRERELPKAPAQHNGDIAPFKLGHVAFNCIDVKKITNFYCDVLGFRVSDWFGDIFSFLRCGPDHHTINLLDAKQVRMNHIAFELRDWGHLHQACDFLSLNGYKLLWGPGRHGIGHNLFAYHRAPNGLITETFCELDRMNEELGYFEPRPWHRDNPQRPKVWAKDPSAANLWGIMPGDEMHH